MYVVSAHRVYAISLPIHYVLVVKEELVRAHQLSLARAELVGYDAVLQNVRELEIVVRYGLPPEHDHSVSIYHVQTDEPYLLLGHDVNDLPVAPLRVELLYARPVRERLIAHRVYVALGERAAVGAAHRLRKLRQSLLPLGLDVEGLALAQVCAFQRAADDVDVVFFLSDPEIYSVVHHLT